MQDKIDSWERKKKDMPVSDWRSPHPRLLVKLSWQHFLPEFPSYWDNLNDNVIFVHKVIYPLSRVEVWGKKVAKCTDEFTEPGADDVCHFNEQPYGCNQQDKVKIFPFKGLNQA